MEPEQAPKTRFLTDVIVELGFATAEEVKTAVDAARLSNRTAEQVLIEQGSLTEEQLSSAVAERYGLEYIDLASYEVNWEAAKLCTRSVARRCHAVPIAFSGNDGLVVAIADPGGGAAAGDIAQLTRLQVRPVVAAKHDIDALIEQLPEREVTPRGPRHEEQAAAAPQQPAAPAQQSPDLDKLRQLADPSKDVDLTPDLTLVQGEAAEAEARMERQRRELMDAIRHLTDVEREFRSALDDVSDKLRVAGDALGGAGHVEELEQQTREAQAARDAAEAERDELRRRLAAIRDTLTPGS